MIWQEFDNKRDEDNFNNFLSRDDFYDRHRQAYVVREYITEDLSQKKFWIVIAIWLSSM